MKDIKLITLASILLQCAISAIRIDFKNKFTQMPASQLNSIEMRCEDFPGQRGYLDCATLCGIYFCPIWGMNGDQCTICGGSIPANYLIDQPGLPLPYDNMYIGKYH